MLTIGGKVNTQAPAIINPKTKEPKFLLEKTP